MGKGQWTLADVEAVAKNYGSILTTKAGARHPWRFVKDGKGVYPVKAHNGKRSVIPWVYIRGLCRAHEIPETAFTG